VLGEAVTEARGEVSLGPSGGADVTHRLRLEREGVRFNAAGRIDLKASGWRPPKNLKMV
jgi:alkylated DNA nucleotide flippase Atl1